MASFSKIILSACAVTLLVACQTGRTQAYRWTNGAAVFDPTNNSVYARGIQKSPAGDIAVEALYFRDSIKSDFGKGANVTVSGKELYMMALKAFSTIDACREKMGVSVVGKAFLNTALSQAAASLGDENAKLRNDYMIEMQKSGACASLASQIERDPAVNIFLDPPAKSAVPIPPRRP
ncbi:MAG: hypothetical protein ACRCWF_08730 [Beijerinckiaceae bacterium]